MFNVLNYQDVEKQQFWAFYKCSIENHFQASVVNYHTANIYSKQTHGKNELNAISHIVRFVCQRLYSAVYPLEEWIA